MSDVISPDLTRRFGDLGGEDVARLDAAAASLGMDTERLMEHAGWQVARSVVAVQGPDKCAVAVVCGGGNNGGDGVVAARLLSTWGFSTRAVVFADDERLTPQYRSRLVTAEHCGVDVQVTQDSDTIEHLLSGCDIALDALLGSGLSGPPREETHPVIAALNQHKVISVDIPSGLDATSGSAAVCVRADATCTLAAMKHGLWTESGRAAAGRIYVGDIGMPAQAWANSGLIQPLDVRNGELIEVLA